MPKTLSDIIIKITVGIWFTVLWVFIFLGRFINEVIEVNVIADIPAIKEWNIRSIFSISFILKWFGLMESNSPINIINVGFNVLLTLFFDIFTFEILIAISKIDIEAKILKIFVLIKVEIITDNTVTISSKIKNTELIIVNLYNFVWRLPFSFWAIEKDAIPDKIVVPIIIDDKIVFNWFVKIMVR